MVCISIDARTLVSHRYGPFAFWTDRTLEHATRSQRVWFAGLLGDLHANTQAYSVKNVLGSTTKRMAFGAFNVSHNRYEAAGTSHPSMTSAEPSAVRARRPLRGRRGYRLPGRSRSINEGQGGDGMKSASEGKPQLAADLRRKLSQAEQDASDYAFPPAGASSRVAPDEGHPDDEENH